MKQAALPGRWWRHHGMRLLIGLLPPAALATLVVLSGQGAAVLAAWVRAGTLPAVVWWLAGAGLGASYLLRSARLHAEWRGHAHLPPGTCLRITLQHLAALHLLPLRAGELGYPVLLQRLGGIALGDAMASLLWMRLQDALVLGGIGTTTLLALVVQHDLMPWTAALTVWLVLLASAAWGLLAARRWAASPAPPDQWASSSGQLGRMAFSLRQTLRQSMHRARPQTWAWCLANWLVKLATVAGLLAALAALPGLPAWCGALGGEMGAAFPVQPPAGFGTYEAGSALAASLAGASGWTGLLGAALVVHLFGMAGAVCGGSLAVLAPAARTAAQPTPTHAAWPGNPR